MLLVRSLPSTLPPFPNQASRGNLPPHRHRSRLVEPPTSYLLTNRYHKITFSSLITLTVPLPPLQPSYAPGYSMYTKPLTNVARSTRAPSFFTPESLRQDLLARESICLSQPLSADSCPSEVDHYHNLCPLERVDTTPPDQVGGLSL